MTRRIRKRTVVVATLVVAVLALAAAAVAYFTATGSGSGAGYLANAQSITVAPVAAAGSALYPGGSSDISATVHNPNSFSVHVHSFVLDASQSDDGIAIGAAGCSRASLTFNGPATNGGGDFVFPPGDTSLTLHDALSMSASAENACQGATFTVYLQASN